MGGVWEEEEEEGCGGATGTVECRYSELMCRYRCGVLYSTVQVLMWCLVKVYLCVHVCTGVYRFVKVYRYVQLHRCTDVHMYKCRGVFMCTCI